MRKLKIGILVDSLTVAFWIDEIVSFILADDRLELSLIVENDADPRPEKPRSLAARIRENRFLYYRFNRIDAKRDVAANAKFLPKDLAPALASVPRIKVRPIAKKFTDRFREEDIAEIRGHDLDIMLRFGFRIIRGAILDCARYGVWSYHHGDNSEYRGGEPGFWEVFEGNPVSGVTLQVLTDSLDGGYVLGKTFRRTHDTSPTLNRLNLFTSGVLLFEHAVDRLTRAMPTTAQFFETFLERSGAYEKRIYKAPTNAEMLLFLARTIRRMIAARFTFSGEHFQWSVGVVRRPVAELSTETLRETQWIQPEADHFIADPCFVRHDGSDYVFVEDFPFENRRGHISVVALGPNQESMSIRPALKQDFHLSFPHAFELEGELYMVPEQAESNRVVLYRCAKFPDEWVEERVLLEGFAGIDSVILFHDERCWLFTTDGRYQNQDSNLCIFHADSLQGTFEPHAQFPVKSSLHGSRMAGAFFRDNGKLFRPAQNAVIRYGGSVLLYEVESLTPHEYRETEVREILPDPRSPFGKAFHTISAGGELTVVDGMRFRV